MGGAEPTVNHTPGRRGREGDPSLLASRKARQAPLPYNMVGAEYEASPLDNLPNWLPTSWSDTPPPNTMEQLARGWWQTTSSPPATRREGHSTAISRL